MLIAGIRLLLTRNTGIYDIAGISGITIITGKGGSTGKDGSTWNTGITGISANLRTHCFSLTYAAAIRLRSLTTDYRGHQ